MSAKGKAQRYIYKIHSSRLRRNNWHLNLTTDIARENNELIALGESQLIRFIDEINNVVNCEGNINRLRNLLKDYRNKDATEENRKAIKSIYSDLDKLLFKKDMVCIVMDNPKDYEYIFINGFSITTDNITVRFKRLLGTAGGIKNSTIVFVNENMWSELDRRINNGRDLNKKFVAAKFEAYKALTCSSSTPISSPKGVVVVKDCETTFSSTILKLDDTITREPVMELIEDYESTMDCSDGFGIAMPSLMKQWADDLGLSYIIPGCVIRNAFLKGAVIPFDFQKFAYEYGDAKRNIIVDLWGNEHCIEEEDIQLILTESMLKLWDSYSSWDDYISNCEQNGYTFAVTKVAEHELEKVRNMNYQFLQSYEFTDEDIEELIHPTMSSIKEVLSDDYRRAILYTKGIHLNDYNIRNNLKGDFASALLIEPEMYNDPYIQSQLRSMIQKRINDAKIGVLEVQGNYSLVTGDPFSLCQSALGMEVTGLLGPGEAYSQEWINRGANKIVAFRAPMICHNNICTFDIANTEDMQDYYQYLTSSIVINSWDRSADTLAGCDFDGDCLITTDNPVLLRTTKKVPPLICAQKSCEKIVPSEKDLFESNIKSFGNEIGAITNRATGMFEVQAKFDKNSEEYKTLDYRIKCGILYQQNAIDKIKGISCKPMPPEWFRFMSNAVNKEKDDKDTIERKEFNKAILAEKKPYFMRYVYPRENSKYNDFIKTAEMKCMNQFNLTLEELFNIKTKTNEQEEFIYYYNQKMPLGKGECTINRICYRFEKEFDHVKFNKSSNSFDYNIMKSNVDIPKGLSKEIEKLYKCYKNSLSDYKQKCKKERIKSYDSAVTKYMLKQEFREKCDNICPNKYVLCDTLLDLCYSKGKDSKQFVWEMCGDVIIENLLVRNQRVIYYPTMCEEGEIEFCGLPFTMKRYEMIEETEDNMEDEILNNDYFE